MILSKLSFVLTCLLFSLCCSPDHLQAQDWKYIPGTKILFSNLTDKDKSNWFSVNYEYFKKEGNIIGVTRGLTEEFYIMLQETPVAFDSIFNNCYSKTEYRFDTSFSNYDTTILKFKFKTAAIIEGWNVVNGYKEVIWQLYNYSWSGIQTRPCITNVVFNRKNEPSANGNELTFTAAFFIGCEL